MTLISGTGQDSVEWHGVGKEGYLRCHFPGRRQKGSEGDGDLVGIHEGHSVERRTTRGRKGTLDTRCLTEGLPSPRKTGEPKWYGFIIISDVKFW